MSLLSLKNNDNIEDKQNNLLSYIIENRNIIMSLVDLFSEFELVDKICKKYIFLL